ncbi:MAG: cysteine-rich CWC family protein [Planctomycetaceae bacterium]|nr:cysteine-rich CWC family protein [Planctomycetaceae bacterium]
MPEPVLPIAVANTTCGACGAELRCGYRAGEDHCWCRELPRLMPVPGDVGTACLCEACLREELARRAGGNCPK